MVNINGKCDKIKVESQHTHARDTSEATPCAWGSGKTYGEIASQSEIVI